MATFADLYMDYLKRSRRKNNIVGKVFFFSALSAAVGAGVALLSSPKSGSENRKTLVKFGKQVGKQAVELEHTAEEKFGDLQKKAESRFKELRSELSGRVDTLRTRLGEKTDDAVEEISAVAKKVTKRPTPKPTRKTPSK
jgi:gas vesicle protein